MPHNHTIDKKVLAAFSFSKLPDSQVSLSGSVPHETIEHYKEHALEHLAETASLPGFRKGHVPAAMLEQHFGAMGILEESFNECLQDLYPALLSKHGVDAVGRPEITVTKMVPGQPIETTITVAVYPVIILPEGWKDVGADIAVEATTEATDDEVETTLLSIRQSRATKAEDSSEVLPEIDDAFAASLGAFETLAQLRAEIKKGLSEEKAMRARDTRRGKIIDALLLKNTVEIPKVFVEVELEKIIAQLKDDISRTGMKFEDYLTHVKKTEADIRTDFAEQAKKRATLQILLNKMAEEASVEADAATVETEMKHALEHFPEAKPDLLRIHIETALRNEAVFKLLEGETK